MISPKLRHRGVPYGGRFELNISDKGMIGKGASFSQLVDSIKLYRKANAIPVGLEFEQEVERETCLKYPDECSEMSPLVPNTDQRRLNVDDIVAGTRSMLAFKMAGSPLVDEGEANRRAAICSRCPWNISFSRPCNFLCGELKDLVHSIIGNKTTKYDDQLKSCAICACYNSASVWIDPAISMVGLSDKQKAQFDFAKTEVGCWKHV